MPKNELKIFSSRYDNSNKEFSGTYMERYVNGKHQEYKVRVQEVWYASGKLEFEGLYKEGTLNSKKCWNSKGKSIFSDSLVILSIKKLRMFKDL